MAIEFFTGFEGCAALGDAQGFFSSGELDGLSTAGFNGSKCVYHDTSVRRTVSARKTIAVGFHVKPNAFSTATGISDFYTLLTIYGPNIIINNKTSGMEVRRDSTLLFSTTDIMPNKSFSHLEVKVFSDAAAGTVQVKLNGAMIIDETAVNTGGGDITTLNFGSCGRHTTFYDNIYIADELQGEIYSYLLKPASDASVQFTPSSGTDNSAMLQTDDGDTSYVESDTIGHKDLYVYEDLPAGLIPVAVVLSTNARKEGTGGRTLQSVSKQDSVDYDVSDPISLSTVYPSGYNVTPMTTVMSLASDGTAWTNEKLNATQIGFKVAG